MKFKMAIAAILNLLFLSILVKWSISGGSRLLYCKISFIYTSIGGWVIVVCAKVKMAAAAILNYKFCNDGLPTMSICAHEISLQISCWANAYFSRYRDSKISQLWLKMPIQVPISMFWGVLTPNIIFFIIETPKRPYLMRKHAFWAINGHY